MPKSTSPRGTPTNVTKHQNILNQIGPAGTNQLSAYHYLDNLKDKTQDELKELLKNHDDKTLHDLCENLLDENQKNELETDLENIDTTSLENVDSKERNGFRPLLEDQTRFRYLYQYGEIVQYMRNLHESEKTSSFPRTNIEDLAPKVLRTIEPKLHARTNIVNFPNAHRKRIDTVIQLIKKISEEALNPNHPMPFSKSINFPRTLRQDNINVSSEDITARDIIESCKRYIHDYSQHCSAILANKPENSRSAQKQPVDYDRANPSKL